MRHVIWDWNGTLLDDASIFLEVVNSLCVDHGIAELSLEEFRQRNFFPLRDCYASMGFQLDERKWDELRRSVLSRYESRRERCFLRADARATLQRIAESSWSQSVLSAHRHAELLDALAHFGIRDYFSHVRGVVAGHGVGKMEQGHELLGELGIPPEEIVLFGDMVHDSDVAEALGIHCVLVADGHSSYEKLVATGRPVVASLVEALAQVENLTKEVRSNKSEVN